jgi:hypothetical protein
MQSKLFGSSATRWLAAGIGIATAAYATYVGFTWFRFGKPKPTTIESDDDLLETFMPTYDVVDRHCINVEAPSELTFSCAKKIDFERIGVVRAIFKTRELILGSKPDTRFRPRGIIAETKALGWGVLAEVPNREIVMGAVTKPWEANPTFHALPPEAFASFAEPGYVKIVWTLRCDPRAANASVLRTETRAVATDDESHRKFRWYWSFLSPGIVVIRRAMLPAVRAYAEGKCHGRFGGSGGRIQRNLELRSRSVSNSTSRSSA